jgi:Kef-type K+ transport system membrane component KefB
VDVQPTNLLVVVAVAALAPVVADLSRGLRVPVIVVEIALGIVVGPQLLDLAHVDGLIGPLSELGLATLFFLAGMEIDLVELRGRTGALAFGGWALSLALGLGAGIALWAAGLIGAPMLVALALTTTSLGALVPILGDAGLAGAPLGRHAIAVGAAGELCPIVGLSLALALATGQIWRTGLLLVFAAVVVGAGLVARRVRPARILRVMETTMHSSGQAAVRLAIVLLAALFVLADKLGLDVILGAFSAGIVVGLVVDEPDAGPFTTKLAGLGYGFLIPIFFIATGLRFDLDGLVSDVANILLVPVVALLLLAVRGLPVWGLYRSELPRRERGSLALLAASALPLVVAITQIAVERDRLAEEDAVVLVGAAMLSLLVFPLAALSRTPGRS